MFLYIFNIEYNYYVIINEPNVVTYVGNAYNATTAPYLCVLYNCEQLFMYIHMHSRKFINSGLHSG